ncbi:MAG: hypothetical protein HYZ45_14630 [Burkholderiales bacterium]|nr:hypothetical protein [Burkholderiales bacterium]
MLRRFRVLALLVCLALSAVVAVPTWAACALGLDESFSRSPEGEESENSVQEYVACKDHPSILHASIVAVASSQANVHAGQDENYDLAIALKYAPHGKVIAESIFPAELPNGGGPRLTSITLDTANYLLAPQLRAFGVRAKLDMRFTFSEELNLFLVKGKKIVKVLSNAPMHIYFSNRWPECREQTREAQRVAVLDKAKSNGWYDILIQEKLIDSEGKVDASGQCQMVPTATATKEYRLKFDGKAYVIPNEMQHFDCRVC